MLRRLAARLFRGAADDAFVRTVDGDTYTGWVDGVQNGRLMGWICAPRSSKRFSVRAASASGVLVSIADRYRADVQRSGHSASGYCGFSFPVDRLAGDSPIHVCVESPLFEIGGSPVTPARQEAARVTKRQTALGDVWLALDAGEGFSGWVLYPTTPTRRPMLLLETESGVQRCAATLFRADAEHQTGDGWRGFSFLPQGVGPYRLRDAETGLELHTFLSRRA